MRDTKNRLSRQGNADFGWRSAFNAGLSAGLRSFSGQLWNQRKRLLVDSRAQSGAVAFRDRHPLLGGELFRYAAHAHINVIAPAAIREALELQFQIVAILGGEGRSSFHITHRTVARLARRNPTLAISENNQADGDRGPGRIKHRPRKRPVVL